MSFSCTTFLAARKQRICPECHATIARGEKYVRSAGKDAESGEFYASTSCLACHDLACAYYRHTDRGYPIGELVWECAEALGLEYVGRPRPEVRVEALARLAEVNRP